MTLNKLVFCHLFLNSSFFGSCATVTAVSSRTNFHFVFFIFSNNLFQLELADISHFRNYNIRNNRLLMVVILFCNFHTRRKIHKRLSASFRFFCVRFGQVIIDCNSTVFPSYIPQVLQFPCSLFW